MDTNRRLSDYDAPKRPRRPVSVSFSTTPITEYFQQSKRTSLSSTGPQHEIPAKTFYSPRKLIKHITAGIDIGSKFISAGYTLQYTDGSEECHIFDRWPVCRHCPQNDSRMPLSEALLEIPSGKLVALGYEAHIRYLNASQRQRKKLMLIRDLSKNVFMEDADRNVTNGTTALDTSYMTFGTEALLQLQKIMVTEMNGTLNKNAEEKILISNITWIITADTEFHKKNLEKILAALDLAPYKIILRSNAVLAYLAGSNVPLLLPATSPRILTAMPRSTHKFISMHISAKKTTITYATVEDGILFPAVRKTMEYGEQKISDALCRLLQTTFGVTMIQSYKKENYEGYVDLVGGIEKAKHLMRMDHDLVVHVPFSFCSHFHKKSKAKIADCPSRMGYKFNPTDNSISIPYSVVVKPFSEYIEKVIGLLHQCLQDQPPDLNATVPTYVTGVFAENILFLELLRSKLNGYDVLVQSEAKFAPLLGALAGQSIKSAKMLRSLYTVGLTAAAHCDREALHVPLARTPSSESYFCDAFIAFVKKDQYLPGRDYAVRKSFFAATPNQQSIWVRVFFAPEAVQVGTVCEDDMECVAQLHLQVPLEKRGVTTGKLFVFEVAVEFEAEPSGVHIVVQDIDKVILGSARVVRPVVQLA
ncbi:uncharacterized protein LOC129593884 [Paramacrobiotus metropolitanus]|uniref:uncharacterized protein LOC129593884 n=1 Tax=Paramacrobiotus metropolitanus TaxID=2943436 RepID=UPI002445CB3E|nr:uncharacterized protein LOC129593884 [Paramacrobiotus metropolitanus]